MRPTRSDGHDADPAADFGADFGRTYWRSAPAAPLPLPPLSPDAIDDATFRLLADNLPTLCWVAKGDGYIVWYNRRWHEYCGTTPERMEGWGWTSVHDPALLPSVMERWTASIATGQPFEMTFPLRGADGLFRPFLTRVQPMRGGHGEVARWFGVNTEIFDQVAAEDALRAERDRSRGVLDSMAEAFVLLDRAFRVLDINAEGLRLDRRPREAIVGRSHWEAWPGTEESELGQLYKRAMAERVPLALEHRYAWPDGRAAWIEVRGYPTADGLALFYRDITERKEAAEALTERGRELQLLTDALPVLVSYIGADERYRFVNRTYEEWFGRSRDDIRGRHLSEVLGEAAYKRLKPNIDRALGGERFGVETRIPYKDGSARDVRIEYVPRATADSRVDGYYSLVQDIGDRKAAEAALRATTARAEALAAEQAAILGQLAEGVIVTDAAGRITFVNEAAARIHGVARLDIAPGAYSDAYHLLTTDGQPYPSEELPLARAVLRQETVLDASWRIHRPDGTEVVAVGSAGPVRDQAGRQIGSVLTLRDDTERAAAEHLLRASESRYRTLFEAIELGFCIVEVRLDAPGGRIDYRVVEANPAFHRQTGFPRAILGRWLRKAAPALEEQWYETYGRVARTGEPERFEQGSAALGRWFDVYAFRQGEPKDRRVGILFNDISARRAAEERLRDLNETLEMEVAARTAERDLLWRNTQDIQVVIDGEGVFQTINPAFTSILGWSEGEVIGRTVFEFIVPEDEAVTGAALTHARTNTLPVVENRYRHKDGGFRWISWVAAPSGGLIYASGRHITEQKDQAEALALAEEQLRQSQKMEAVGQLTGGIAHDFNNMLAAVVGSLDLLGRRIGTEDARARRYADAAMEGARRAALLTQRLLAFSRQQPLKPEPIAVNALVAGMSELIRGSIGGDVRLETVLASGLWRAHADPNQLENAILNLAVNARDAMPEGGRLTIETQNAHIDERYAAANLGVPAGQYVLIAVTDTGAGMAPEVIAKAFDPFFTTKEVGKGTGLGLSQVYGFVRQSGGHVKIYSEPGEGTTVKVYLPRLAGAGADAPVEGAAAGLPLGEGQEVILVVEDEPAVRQVSVDALTELGYGVLEADGAAAALRLIDAHPGIALLFTDVVMPDTNGRKLADEARRRRPDLKVLFTTGYTRNAVVHNGVLDPGVELIGKPFTIKELAAKMRAILDRPSDDPTAPA